MLYVNDRTLGRESMSGQRTKVYCFAASTAYRIVRRSTRILARTTHVRVRRRGRLAKFANVRRAP